MNHSQNAESACFIPFKGATDTLPLPERFTFPFYYEPHPLAILASEELQEHLENQTEWEHNFGLEANQEGLVIGKMFGVLVVRNPQNEIGYLAAFSGKLAGENHHSLFVPPVFDMLTEEGFFKKEEAVLNQINAEIEALENNPEFLSLEEFLKTETTKFDAESDDYKKRIKASKKERKAQREKAVAEGISTSDLEILLEELRKESLKQAYFLKDFIRQGEARLEEIQQKVNVFRNRITFLKEERKNKSNALQQQLFEQYSFLNAKGETKSLFDIFKNTVQGKPPAAAGECAAPKLLHYAYQHQLEPICMAEFWWGQSPKSEIRKHKHFYPACRGKCEPILGHMLEGLKVDDNPMLVNPADGVTLETIYEDDYIAIVNKPAEFLSVPGITIQDSVYERMRLKYPNATGPLIVHRLDMSTSGLMLIAKDKGIHKSLQSQFIKRTVKKRYTALLNGLVSANEGEIDLPLRVDLEDRPRQLVCYEYGKPAKTKWKVVSQNDNKTKIHFWPITGRTHQLRVHASHSLGLNCPIFGDDLYGTKADRLHLHAEWIEFRHPITREVVTFEVAAEF
ncbi:RluA family pseudouridine synthase [Flavobacterium suncheonense]|uniref:Pseudouridine synthase n=1 Tax=Flavobacterium suncheonense GH29-5 = DSM 17707 TaxID=1121899 RepID=A0A0A2MB61_9FLAO|nr:pseudouridine synthase [Flavobacterium suncheonense]KGO89922.1 pseudouridine synthase [Flavobacterium suncheonense GH29-5 = DSM 17707]